jgi:MBG domain (YGX type)
MNAVLPVMLKSKIVLGSTVFCLMVLSAAGTVSATPSIKVLRGANQQTTYGADFPAPLEVWVTDTTTERAVSGLRIDFTPGAGVLLSSSFATTDERGLASVTATALAACTSSVSAEVAGVPDARVNFEGLVADKAVLTVIPANLVSRQASSVPVISVYTITGFVNGDTAETAQIKGLPVLTTTVGDHSSRANYAIKGGVGSLSAPNYTFVAGFGTLAILEGQDTDNARVQAQAASPASLSSDEAVKDDEVEVRSALLGQTATLTVPEPEFLAGLRGQSGVFVVKAIWTEPASVPDHAQHLDTRSALAPVAAGAARVSDAPVRPVEIPKMATLSVPAPQLSNTMSALAPMPVAMQKGTDAPVRAVLLNSEPSAAARTRSSVSGHAIRSAFNPAGSN